MTTHASETRSKAGPERGGVLERNLEALAAVDAAAAAAVRAVCASAAPAPCSRIAAPDRPLVIVGACVRAAASVAALEQAGGSYRPRIDAVEPDASAAASGLSTHDVSEAIAGGWLRWSVGAAAADRFAERLAVEPLERAAPALVGPVPPGSQDAARRVRSALEARSREQQASLRATLDRLHSRYAGCDASWWRARLAEGLRGDRPLRALVPTYRHAHFVCASARDLRDAWRRAGHTAELLMEPDDLGPLTPLAWATAIERVEPDVILAINYRREVSPETKALPIPWVCWVQDPLPGLLAPPRGAPNALDCLIGHEYPELLGAGGSAGARFVATPVVVEPRRFESAAHIGSPRSCEVLYVGNQSEPPERMAARLRAGLTGVPFDGARFVDAVCAALPGVQRDLRADGADALGLLDGCVRGALGPTGERAPRGMVSMLRTQIVEPLLERTIRHETLGWAAEICARRGWRLEIHGRGWDDTQRFAALARGPVPHGPELAAVYRDAAVCLHASCRPPLHQRVFEAAVSGGLPVVRWFGAFGPSPEELLARDGLWRGGAGTPPPDLPGARGNIHWEKMLKAWDAWWWVAQAHDRFGYPISGDSAVWIAVADAPSLMARVAESQRRGETPAWLEDGAARISPWKLAHLTLHEPASPSLRGAVADPGETAFVDADGLERVIERAIERPAWRAAQTRAIADRVRERYTYDAVVRSAWEVLSGI